MEVVIADAPEYEELFADIRFNDQYWARVIYDKEKGAFVVMIFPPFDGAIEHIFLLDETLKALIEAKQRLRELGYKMPGED